MIYVSSIQALYEELPWETKVLANLESFFIYVFCREIFCDAAVVGVAELYLVVLMIKQIVDIYIIDVTLNVLEINIRLFVALAACYSTIIFHTVLFFFIIFFLFLGFVLVGFFKPSMGEDLGDRQSRFWLQLDHTTDEGLSFGAELVGESEITFENQLVEVLKI